MGTNTKIKARLWVLLFTPICALHLRYGVEWRWVAWLYVEVGACAMHAEEVALGLFDDEPVEASA